MARTMRLAGPSGAFKVNRPSLAAWATIWVPRTATVASDTPCSVCELVMRPVICRTWACAEGTPTPRRRSKMTAAHNRCAMAPPGGIPTGVTEGCTTVQPICRIGKTPDVSGSSGREAESWRGPGEGTGYHGGSAGIGPQVIEPVGHVGCIHHGEVRRLAGLE